MLSLRLRTIASLVKKNEKILDIGTDHALLPIYLIQNNIIKSAIASDISDKVIQNAFKNIKKRNLENKIKLYVSDGFKNIVGNYNLVIISGMGAYNIINILENSLDSISYIIEANNNEHLIRNFFNKNEYKIINEKIVFENGHYYDIIRYEKGKEKLKKEEILFGKSYNLDYYNYLYKKYNVIIKNVPFFKKIYFLKYIIYLKKLIYFTEKKLD